LFCGQYVNEPAAERIEVISRLDVSMKGRRVELRENEDAIDIRVDAVADRDIDEPVFARERDGRFAAFLSQGVKTCAATAAHDDSQNAFWGEHRKSLSRGLELASPLGGSLNFAKQK
jgi:hypothetical protein